MKKIWWLWLTHSNVREKLLSKLFSREFSYSAAASSSSVQEDSLARDCSISLTILSIATTWAYQRISIASTSVQLSSPVSVLVPLQSLPISSKSLPFPTLDAISPPSEPKFPPSASRPPLKSVKTKSNRFSRNQPPNKTPTGDETVRIPKTELLGFLQV